MLTFIHISIHVDIYVCMYNCVFMDIHINMHAHACLPTDMYTICTPTFTYVCMHACM